MVEHFSTNRSPVSSTIRRYSYQDNTPLSDIYKLLIISLYFLTPVAQIYFLTHTHTHARIHKKKINHAWRVWVVFGCVRWDETLRVPNVFIFVTEKEHNFPMNENIAILHLRERKQNLIYLNSDRYFVVYCLNASKQKLKCIGATLAVFSLAAVVWSGYTTPPLPRWRKETLRDKTKWRLRKRLRLPPSL